MGWLGKKRQRQGARLMSFCDAIKNEQKKGSAAENKGNSSQQRQTCVMHDAAPDGPIFDSPWHLL